MDRHNNVAYKPSTGLFTPWPPLINYPAAELRGMSSCLGITSQSTASRNMSYSDSKHGYKSSRCLHLYDPLIPE